MSNINQIQVNGTTYGLDVSDGIVISRTKPTGEVLPKIWVKPNPARIFMYDIGMEIAAGQTSAYGNYTLNAQGELVATTDTATGSAVRATKFVSVKEGDTFKIVSTYTWTPSASYNFTWSVFFYQEDGTFISSTSGTVAGGTAMSPNTTILNFTIPQGCAKVRFLIPYGNTYGRYGCVAHPDFVVDAMFYSNMQSYPALMPKTVINMLNPATNTYYEM